MSDIANWSYNAEATVWPRTGSGGIKGGTTYGEPYVIACDYQSTDIQKHVDANGQEFVVGMIFYHEDARVKYLDRIKMGNHLDKADPMAAGAEVIRGHLVWNMLSLDDPVPDYKSVTDASQRP